MRVLGALLVAVPVVVVVSGSPPPTVTQQAGLALMVLSAAPLGWGLGEVVRRWRPGRHRPPRPAVARAPAAALA